MKKIYILEADPTRYGGIQQFCRNLAEYLPDKAVLLAYYGDLAYEKAVSCPVVKINNRKFFKGVYLSLSGLLKNLALLLDIPQIRRNLAKQLNPGDTLLINSASAMFFFCSKKVLKEHRIILVQHTAPFMMYQRAFDFGGIFRKYKLSLFRQYVDSFVMLSPFEKKDFGQWLPLENKDCRVIRHALSFPEKTPEKFPRAAAVLSRLIPLKQVEKTIACAKLLSDVQFNIYGTGPEEKKLKELAADVPNVYFHGYENDIDKVFENNSVLLITSLYEGYSIAGIEACIHGRAVIVFDTYRAAQDLVSDGESGIVLKEHTPEAMAKAVKQVLAEPEKFRAGALEHRKIYQKDIAQRAWQDLFDIF